MDEQLEPLFIESKKHILESIIVYVQAHKTGLTPEMYLKLSQAVALLEGGILMDIEHDECLSCND